MMRSLYAGVSGLQNHQTRMDVIGNNISNVNTTGFKRARVNFQDMISQQTSGAARPTDEVGGINPKEVGLGMTIATIDNIFNQGNLQSTGISTDVAIKGNGFFILKEGEETFYTRNGAFGIDMNGTLVNPANGMKVQGWMSQELNGETVLQTAATPTDLTIPVGAKDPARETVNVRYACNLNKNTPEIREGATDSEISKGTWRNEQIIYDSFGNEHNISIAYTRVEGEPNLWHGVVFIDEDNAEVTQTRLGIGTTDGMENEFYVRFDNYGLLEAVYDGNGPDGEGANSITTGEAVFQLSYTVPESNGDEEGNPYRQTLNLVLGTIGSSENSTTQSTSSSTNKAYFQDGRTMGYLDNYKIDSSGIITGVYTNGTNRAIGQIALATFANQQGLEKGGDSTYKESINSGMARINEAGIAGTGSLMAGALEMSNVDLSEQMTDMIITQRGFQANSKTITTADTLLETVLSLKR